MKSAVEVYRALMEGETLKIPSEGTLLKVGEDKFFSKDVESDVWLEHLGWTVTNPNHYEIYKEPKWHDGDLSDGVLCRVHDYDFEDWELRLIVGFDSQCEDEPFLDTNSAWWMIAEPIDLTKPIVPQLQS